MLDSLEENMKMITGREELLKKVLVTWDTGYFSEQNLQEEKKRNIEVLIPDQQFRKRDPSFERQKCHGWKGRFTVQDFFYNIKANAYICPNKKTLIYKRVC
jgi:hypothetical protein